MKRDLGLILLGTIAGFVVSAFGGSATTPNAPCPVAATVMDQTDSFRLEFQKQLERDGMVRFPADDTNNDPDDDWYNNQVFNQLYDYQEVFLTGRSMPPASDEPRNPFAKIVHVNPRGFSQHIIVDTAGANGLIAIYRDSMKRPMYQFYLRNGTITSVTAWKENGVFGDN